MGWFLRYGSLFKITIFGDETWPSAKVAESALSFYTKVLKLSLHFALQAGVFEIWADLGHGTCPLGKLPETHIYCLSTYGVETEHIFAPRVAVFKIFGHEI